MSQLGKKYSTVQFTPDRAAIKELVWQRLSTALIEDKLDSGLFCSLSQREELKAIQRRKEEQAFARLYEQYRQPLIHYVMKKFAFSYQDSEELVQDTFCRLWTNRKLFNRAQSAEQYLFTSAHNRVIDHKRSEALKREKRRVIASLGNHQGSKEDQVIYREYSAWFQKSIENLPPRTRKVFCLNVLEGKSTRQIAQELGSSLQTVKNQLNSATRLVKTFLQAYSDS